MNENPLIVLAVFYARYARCDHLSSCFGEPLSRVSVPRRSHDSFAWLD